MLDALERTLDVPKAELSDQCGIQQLQHHRRRHLSAFSPAGRSLEKHFHQVDRFLFFSELQVMPSPLEPQDQTILYRHHASEEIVCLSETVQC